MAKNNTRFICTVTILALIIIVGGVSPASSDIRLKDYETFKDTEGFKYYIYGVERGLAWANTTLFTSGSKILYCQPNELALSKEEILDILKREIDKNAGKYTIDTPVELILMYALMRTFPCK
jgi:hypothetical protein